MDSPVCVLTAPHKPGDYERRSAVSSTMYLQHRKDQDENKRGANWTTRIGLSSHLGEVGVEGARSGVVIVVVIKADLRAEAHERVARRHVHAVPAVVDQPTR